VKLYLLGVLTIYFIAAVKVTNGVMCAYTGDLRYTLRLHYQQNFASIKIICLWDIFLYNDSI